MTPHTGAFRRPASGGVQDEEDDMITIETTFKVGDTVRTGYGEVGAISDVRPDGEQRDGSWSDRPVYYVESGKGGSPIVWWYAEQLELAPLLTDEQRYDLQELDAWYRLETNQINQLRKKLDLEHNRRRQALIEKHRSTDPSPSAQDDGSVTP